MNGLAPDPPAPVCVIVPTYNRAALLAEAINSLRTQTCPPARILVINDGSTDGTAALLARMTDVDVIWQENAGKAAALNRALEQVFQPLVWIFDDDDLAHPTALTRLHDALVARPEAIFSYGDHDLFWSDGDGGRRHAPAPPTPPPDQLYMAVMVDCLVHQPGMLVRRDALLRVGPFDSSLVRSQDYDMLLRLTRLGVGDRVNGIVFHQRQHDGLRGSAAQPLAGRDRGTLWPQFDRRIFERIARDYALCEYLPNISAEELTEQQKICALVTRLSFLGRKGLWKNVSADLRQLGATYRRTRVDRFSPSQVARLTILFDRRASGLAQLDVCLFWMAAGALPAWRLRTRLRLLLVLSAPAIARAKARVLWPGLFHQLRGGRERLRAARRWIGGLIASRPWLLPRHAP